MFGRSPVSCVWLTIVFAISANTARAEISTAILADNQEDTYERCITLAQDDAEAGLDMALRWIGLEGGNPARHCKAVALRALGDFEAAAAQLEMLAEAPEATAPVKAGLYTQAARAWMDAAVYDRGRDLFSKAIVLNPNDPMLRFDRALSNAALADFWSTIDDLNYLLDVEPDNKEALTLRGGAYRRLDIPDLASDDIERALALDATYTDALLERGLLARANGDTDAAREAWIQVLQIAPDSAVADAVRTHLQDMDLRPDP
jgi:tetratricopeptide (TPR) repeat protein